MIHMQTAASVMTNWWPGKLIQGLDNRHKVSISDRRSDKSPDKEAGRQRGSAKSVYLPAGRQGGVVKGGGGGGGQEEAEPEQEHS